MSEPADDMVAKSVMLKRISAKQDQIDSIQSQLTSLQAEYEGYKTTQKDLPDYGKLETRLQKANALHAATTDAFEAFKINALTERTLFAAGITDADDQALVRWTHGRIPEADRGSLEDYLGEEGGARGHRNLSHLFAAPADPAPAEPPTSGRQPQALPNVNGGIKRTSGPSSPMSIEAIMNMPKSERLKPENRALITEALKR